MSLGAVSRALGINDGNPEAVGRPGPPARFIALRAAIGDSCARTLKPSWQERSNGPAAIVSTGDDPEAPVLRRIRRKLSQIDLSAAVLDGKFPGRKDGIGCAFSGDACCRCCSCRTG